MDMRMLGLAALATLPLAATAQEMRDVTGQASYAARIALPEDAVVAVTARGLRGVLLALDRFPTGGGQVPLDFALAVPADVTAQIRVTILGDDGALWHAAPVAVAPGREAVDLGQVMLDPGAPMTGTTLFLCGDTAVAFGMFGDQYAMEVNGARYPVSLLSAASGARFEGADPGTFFWSQGDAALVSVAGETLPECAAVPEIYTAQGNEPSWSLVAVGQDPVDYTLARLGAPDVVGIFPAAIWSNGAALWDAGRGGPLVRMREALCRDSMTGMPYPETVEVTMGEDVMIGCGGDPRDLLAGGEWRVEDISGRGVFDSALVTLEFDARGRVFGSAGCNRWFAGYELTGETLRFGPAGATSMACAPALMDQEMRFLAALDGVAGFDIDATGALRLLSVGGAAVIMARRG